MKVIFNVLLFLVSVLMAGVLLPIGMTYGFFRGLGYPQALRAYSNVMLSMAILIDRAGNVLLGDLMNDVLRKGGGYRFGDERDTISYVLGKNKSSRTLTWFGVVVARILNWIDEDHVEKAVMNKGN